jgi:hypothetical protein
MQGVLAIFQGKEVKHMRKIEVASRAGIVDAIEIPGSNDLRAHAREMLESSEQPDAPIQLTGTVWFTTTGKDLRFWTTICA